MHHSQIAIYLCVIGLGAVISFAQTSRHMTVGPYSSFLGLLLIPAAVAILWRLSQMLHWWTILLFLFISVMIGILNSYTARRYGQSIVYSMQPVLGTVYVACAVGAWIAR